MAQSTMSLVLYYSAYRTFTDSVVGAFHYIQFLFPVTDEWALQPGPYAYSINGVLITAELECPILSKIH